MALGFAVLGAASSDTLTNASILELQKFGLGDAVILEKIASSADCRFEVEIQALKKLKEAGVSSEVIAAMVRKAGAVNTPAADPNDPAQPHAGGIYYVDETISPPRLALLEPTVYSQTKSGGFFKSALTAGIAKIKSKALLNGSHAMLQLTARRPVFYFYFETTGQGLSQSGQGYFGVATSANEFLLVKTDAKERSRELVVGQANAFGAQGGVMDKSIVGFDFVKLSPGIYKVTPKSDLGMGEYCFFYAGSAPVATYGFSGPQGGGKVFDFGVK